MALVTGLTTAVVILAAVAVAHYVRARGREADGGPTPRIRSIAVLPFEDLSAAKTDVHYADGLIEALITELSTLEGFEKVIGRQSVARFRASPVPIRDAARVLGVDAIVTAAILRSAGRLRVTARLVDGVTERHLWAATYERPDAAAFDAYIAGRQAVHDGPPGALRAVGHFETAIALDPEFAPAHAALADALWITSMFETAPSDVYRRGRTAAARAIALDTDGSESTIHNSGSSGNGVRPVGRPHVHCGTPDLHTLLAENHDRDSRSNGLGLPAS